MIIITTMDKLPDYCHNCPCYNSEFGNCKADPSKRNSEWRPFWCPLKEIKDNQDNQEEINTNNKTVRSYEEWKPTWGTVIVSDVDVK